MYCDLTKCERVSEAGYLPVTPDQYTGIWFSSWLKVASRNDAVWITITTDHWLHILSLFPSPTTLPFMWYPGTCAGVNFCMNVDDYIGMNSCNFDVMIIAISAPCVLCILQAELPWPANPTYLERRWTENWRWFVERLNVPKQLQGDTFFRVTFEQSVFRDATCSCMLQQPRFYHRYYPKILVPMKNNLLLDALITQMRLLKRIDLLLGYINYNSICL